MSTLQFGNNPFTSSIKLLNIGNSDLKKKKMFLAKESFMYTYDMQNNVHFKVCGKMLLGWL